MAYVGTPLDTTNAFQSLAGKRFSGDASTTGFTLDSSPNSTLDIEVFVDNVRQDPNSAYTVSGTTLTFTAAPPTGTNNIYVVHQAKSVGTIDVPSASVQSGSLNSAFFTGATDIGAAIADADLLLLDDGAGGTLRKTAASRLKTYITGKVVQYVIGTNSAEGTNGTSTDAATGLTLDITPTDANNKMVIFAQDVYKTENDGSTNASGRTGFFTLYKDTSKLNDTKAIVGGNLASSATSALPSFFGTVVLMGTETAGSTSERTYKLMCDTNGTSVVTFNEEGFDSFIIALELAV